MVMPQKSADVDPQRSADADAGEQSGRFYIPANSSFADERISVLKHGDTFAIFDRFGDMRPTGLREQGLYHEGTRHLSRLEFRIEGFRPILLNSAVKRDNALYLVDLTNPDFYSDGELAFSKDAVHAARSSQLWSGTLYQKFEIRNFSMARAKLSFFVRFEADFSDIFEVRGLKRPKRGSPAAPRFADGSVTLGYQGLDGMLRETVLRFSPQPEELTAQYAFFEIDLKPHEEKTFLVTAQCAAAEKPPEPAPFDVVYTKAKSALRASQFHACGIYTSNEPMNEWIRASFSDLHTMCTDLPTGLYPYAGVPWFSTPFGRDGILTALEYLWVNPNIARGVLSFLAKHQAKELNPFQDAEPGKILHEVRKGEMAALREIPFGLYYGSVDSTPLYVMLAGAYYERTGDLDFVKRLWPSIEAALKWIDEYGDVDRDGFVDYARKSPTGLVQQGWKDSHDSVFHEDGSLAQGPIALCEVQGYVFAAKNAAAMIAAKLGKAETARRLETEASALQLRFKRAFWCEELGTYALALDGDKKPCRVRSSNAGHCLYTGIASPEHAAGVAKALFAADSWSGWGIRTLSSLEKRYNPMSYHNGSVWPHDNALIAMGLSRYGRKDLSLKMLGAFLEASTFIELQRMPELFCGFDKKPGEGPILYPVACAPQSWAAASAFLFIKAALGLVIKGPEQRIYFSYPQLPDYLPQIRLKNLRIGESSVDLLMQKTGDDVSINVTAKEGRIEVVTAK